MKRKDVSYKPRINSSKTIYLNTNKRFQILRRMEKRSKYAIILLSGGIDSTACVHYLLEEKYNIDSVFIDYGQKSRDKELSSARRIAEYYKIKLNKIDIKTSNDLFSSGEIIGRNALLIFTVIMYQKINHGFISLGIHSGTPYYDCSKEFVKRINDILNGYSGGRILIHAPFLKWDKYMIFQYCKDNGVPLHLTYSCENGTDPPCGECLSCRDRKILDVSKKIEIKD